MSVRGGGSGLPVGSTAMPQTGSVTMPDSSRKAPSSSQRTRSATSRRRSSWLTMTMLRWSSVARRRSSRPMSRPCPESRLAVGSSASRTAGSLARAWATATRCFSPPESWSPEAEPVPEPDLAEEVDGAGAGGATDGAGEVAGELDVLAGAECGEQVEVLEDEPEVVARSAGRRRSGAARSTPSMTTEPLVGRSMAPSIRSRWSCRCRRGPSRGRPRRRRRRGRCR